MALNPPALASTAASSYLSSASAATTTTSSNPLNPPVFGSTFAAMSAATSLYTDDRSADLERAKSGLSSLEKQMESLLPAQEELRAQRQANEAELAQVTRKKQELTLKLSQASATFEAEQSILKENQAILERERQLVAIGQQELQQAESILAARRAEKEQLLNAVEAVKTELAECNEQIGHVDQMTRQYQEETEKMRPRFAELHAELKKQGNLLDINKQVLTSAQIEYNQLKADTERDEEKLEADKKKLQQLNAQINVQTAINEKERVKLMAAQSALNDVKASISSAIDNLAWLTEQKSSIISQTDSLRDQASALSKQAPASATLAPPSTSVVGPPVTTTNSLTPSLLSTSSPRSRPPAPPPPASKRISSNISKDLLLNIPADQLSTHSESSIVKTPTETSSVVDGGGGGGGATALSQLASKMPSATHDLNVSADQPQPPASLDLSISKVSSKSSGLSLSNGVTTQPLASGPLPPPLPPLSTKPSKGVPSQNSLTILSTIVDEAKPAAVEESNRDVAPSATEPSIPTLDAKTEAPNNNSNMDIHALSFETQKTSTAGVMSDAGLDSLSVISGRQDSIRGGLAALADVDIDAEFKNAFDDKDDSVSGDLAPVVVSTMVNGAAAASSDSNAASDVSTRIDADVGTPTFNLRDDAFTFNPDFGSSASTALSNGFAGFNAPSLATASAAAVSTSVDFAAAFGDFDSAFSTSTQPASSVSPNMTAGGFDDAFSAAFDATPLTLGEAITKPAPEKVDLDALFGSAFGKGSVGEDPSTASDTARGHSSINGFGDTDFSSAFAAVDESSHDVKQAKKLAVGIQESSSELEPAEVPLPLSVLAKVEELLGDEGKY